MEIKDGISRNLPCEDGERVGKAVAAMNRGSLEKIREKFPSTPGPCKTCAFREGTFANRCLSTVADALKCVMELQTFYCHESEDCREICNGWAIAIEALPADYKPIEMPWPFTGVDPQDAKKDPVR